MTARTEVVNLLQAAFTAGSVDATVIPYSRDIEVVGKPTVMVRIDEVTPGVLANIVRSYNFALIAMVPQTAPGVADAALDGFLEQLLSALEGSAVANRVVWSKATRATYEDKYPAYQVDISVHFN